jgi:hypothetical protein
MIDSVKALTTFEGDEWQEYLERICLIEIFKELIHNYKDQPGVVKSLIRYIVWAYSKNSEMVPVGGNWLNIKKRIFEAACIPLTTEFENAVIFLSDPAILNTVLRWIKFQDEDTFQELEMLKELRTQMQLSIYILTDYDQKFKNAKYSIELLNMIRDTEKKLLQNDPHLKEAIKEAYSTSKVRENLGPELFSK